MDEDLIDRIYEAGAVPELWLGVLDDVTRIADGIGSVLWVTTQSRWIVSPSIEQTMIDYVASGLAADNPRTGSLISTTQAGFITDHDAFAHEEMIALSVYRDFFIPRGGGLGVATTIPTPSGDVIVLHAERRFANGPLARENVRRLDDLRPHFARAALLSARLSLQRAQAATAALEAVGLPAAILGHAGRIVSANALFASLVPNVVQDRRARMALVNPAADRLLDEAIAAPKSAGAAIRSIPVVATADQPPQIVHLVPVRRSAHDIFTGATTIVVVTPVVVKEVPTAEVVQALFDLTPAEARVAREIGNGRSAAEIAVKSAVQIETVRTQIKAVLGKTGLHRQAELVALLQGASFHLHMDD